MHTTHLSSGGRYPVLRTVAILFMLGAVFAVIGGIYWLVRTLQMINVWDRVTWSAVAVSAAFFSALISVGMAELIKLLIDMEHNTRVAAQQSGVDARAAAAMTSPAAAVPAGVDGQPAGRTNQWLEGEETAEGALLRGH